MKLYHISLDWNKDDYFEPRIPSFRMGGEDGTVPRICLSTTVEGCLTAIPGGGKELFHLLENVKSIVKVFVFDTDKMNLKEGDLLDSETLYEEYNVHDAPHTKEFWSLVPLVASESHFVFIEDWDGTAENVYPYEIDQIAGSDYGGDIEEAYYSIIGKQIPNIGVIEDAEVIWDVIPAGKELCDIEFDIIDEGLVIKYFDIEPDDFTPKIRAKKDVDLKEFADELDLFKRIYG